MEFRLNKEGRVNTKEVINKQRIHFCKLSNILRAKNYCSSGKGVFEDVTYLLILMQ